MLLGLLPWAGCAKEPAQEKPPAVAARAAQLRFEPPRRDHEDVGIGETLVDHIELVADAPVEWGEYALATSCECLDARFVGEKTPTRAPVEVTVFGRHREDVDGRVRLLDAANETVLEFSSHVVVSRRPFVQPREVAIDRGPEGRFEIVVGQAFDPKGKAPDLILPELGAYDETKLVLYDFGDEVEKEHTDTDLILRNKVVFLVVEEARAEPFETAIPITFGEPPVTRSVKVRWPGR